jgi:hypothetical protein
MTENIFNVLSVNDTDSDSDFESNDKNDKNDIKKNNKKKIFDYIPKKNTWNYEKKEKKINHKKILCQNMIIHGSCAYTDRCLYAHKLDEQKIDIKRKKTFDLLDSNSDLSFIDVNKHKDIYKEFMLFTIPCMECINNKCTGGNNCKFGSPFLKYIICYEDLNYGICEDNNCERKHLTKRGLKPIYNNISINLNQPSIDNINMLKPVINNLLLFNNINKSINNLTNAESDTSDDECEKSIFNSKYDLLDKQLD